MKRYQKLWVVFFSICLLYILFPVKTTWAEEENIGYASDGQEFMKWLASNKTKGGTLYLTDDIILQDNFDYLGGMMMRYLKPVTIYTSGHHIYVEEILSLDYCGYLLTIEGDGTEEGLIHVRAGGLLYLSMVNIRAGGSARAVTCEAGGGVLMAKEEGVAAVIEGDVVMDSRPLVLRDQQAYNYESIQPGEEEFNESLLPDREKVTLMYGTGTVQAELLLDWDLESVEENIRKKERCGVQGSYTGTVVLEGIGELEASSFAVRETPVCSIIFSKEGAAIRDSYWETTDGEGNRILSLFYQVPASSLRVACLVSEDNGNNWDICMEGEADITIGEWDQGVFRIEIPFDKEPLFCIQASYENGRELYTEVIGLGETALISRGDIGGNRGGGTDINGDNVSQTKEEESPESAGQETGKTDAESPQALRNAKEELRIVHPRILTKKEEYQQTKPAGVQENTGQRNAEQEKLLAAKPPKVSDYEKVPENPDESGEPVRDREPEKDGELSYTAQIAAGLLILLALISVFICIFRRRKGYSR